MGVLGPRHASTGISGVGTIVDCVCDENDDDDDDNDPVALWSSSCFVVSLILLHLAL